MNFVIPSRDPATSPKTKSEYEIENSSSSLGQHCFVAGPLSRDRPRFFDQVDYQTTYASIGNRHFFTKSYVMVRPTKLMNNLLKVCKICTFLLIFPYQKSTKSFWFFKLIFYLQARSSTTLLTLKLCKQISNVKNPEIVNIW